MKRLRLQLAIIPIAMLLPLIWVATQMMPGNLGSTEEIVRLRNALLIEPSSPADFSWTPRYRPDSFLVNSVPIPAEVAAFVAPYSTITDTWARSLELINKLRQRGPLGDPIQRDTVTTLRYITERGLGYCSDYTQVFNALAYASGIETREWGVSFDGYGGWGHAFNEIFIPERQQWVFVDIFHGFYTSSGEQPLSTAEFRQSLIRGDSNIRINRFDQGRFLFPSEQAALDYYRRGIDQFYLWWGTASLNYDAHPIMAALAPLSRTLEQLAAIALGIHPSIRPIESPNNVEMRQAMYQLRSGLLISLIAEITLGIFFVVLLQRYLREARKTS